MIFLQFFFFELLQKFNDFVNSDDCIGKITSKSISLYPIFIKKKDLKSIKNRFFLVKKLEIQVIIYDYAYSFSETIFNPMHYTGT